MYNMIIFNITLFGISSSIVISLQQRVCGVRITLQRSGNIENGGYKFPFIYTRLRPTAGVGIF